MVERKKRTRSTSSSVDPATQYARDVTDGKVIAGPDIRNACKRHLRDLEEGPSRGLVWDTDAVKRVIDFYAKVLKLNGGEHEGAPFILLPWQCFVVGSLFGWKRADGSRRFRTAYVESGKGSGKSPLAAGVGLYCLVADREPRAEVYAAATKKDQAMILFRDAVAMVDQSPALSQRIDKSGGAGKEWNLAYLQAGSFFRPISSDDGQSGPRPHCALIDEIHEHKDNRAVEMMRAGTKGRRQALIFMITNSGHDKTSVCYDYHQYGQKVAAGQASNDAFFAFICSLDDGDDPFKDESCWGKANPSMGYTFRPDYLREQVEDARGMPAKESLVRRLNFCQWVDAENPWISGDVWMACEQEISLESLRGETCYGGLDLSGKRDLTSLSLYFPKIRTVLVEFWTPGDTLFDRARVDRVPYDAWLRDGYLHAPKGSAIDYGFVAKRIAELSPMFDIKSIAFDRYHIDYLIPELDDEGVTIPLTPHGQGFGKSTESGLWMPHSIELLEQLITEKKIIIVYNPCLRWNAANAVIEEDKSGNRVFSKRRSNGRIDGVVAMAMSVGAADGVQEEEGDIDGFFDDPIMVGI
ncbi:MULTISPECIES: terminase large subunit [Edwardsiella]|uniref:Terminase large subunit n=1 Tax=Edwardsiella anguillarum TaxID=1821960 RepID=A0ABY8SDN6_9GAMM|nr:MULTISPECIES: terminase TerL endonuclease subunit [Edwardsiella]AOP43669.1 terminase large subunit [Edwardsiella piscicida]EKS7779745.1 terminase large subunit [Edwardsiella piscicida]EKS7783167.1 terminase large subunit [Edwardsiella piscicida]EKS7813008.1 terminase large subunit [Edwardsiella piscicida]UCQ20180.1 terminase large subunit [Edwardsiella piscicida]